MRARLAAALLLLSSTALAQDATGKTKLAKLYLGGDRIVEGEVIAEDDQTITIKTAVAEAPFSKKEILLAVRSEVTAAELKARKHVQNVYTSLLLGYRLAKPDEWSFKFDPPEPLSDVIVQIPKEELRLTVFGVPDALPDQPIDDSTLKGLADTIEGKLREKFIEVKRTAAEKTTFTLRGVLTGDVPAAYVEFSMRDKDSKRDFKEGSVVVKCRKKVIYFGAWAPAARFDKAKKALDDVIATVELTDSSPQEGDRLWNQESLYALQKPSDWTFAKGSEMQAPGNEAWLRVEPKKLGPTTLESWAKDAEPGLASSLGDAKKIESGGANVCGRLGQHWVFEYQDAGRPRRRTVWLVKEDDRGYQLTADAPTDKEQYPPLLAEAVSKFRILNDLLAEGALERGMKAIDLFDQGDKRLDERDYTGAVALYEEALAAYPRFAGAWNNLGAACDRAKDFDKSRRAMQRAFDLFPEDHSIRVNFGLALIREEMKDLDDKKGDDAARVIERARVIIPPDCNDGLKRDLYVGLMNVSIYYENKESWSQAVAFAEKALTVKPGDPELTRHLGQVYANAAVSAWNKKSRSSAVSWAKKALKVDPSNQQAKQVMDMASKSK